MDRLYRFRSRSLLPRRLLARLKHPDCGDTHCACFQDPRRVFFVDAPDCENRDANRGAHLAQAIQSNRGLVRRVEDRAKDHEIGSCGFRGASFLRGVAGNTQDVD